MTCGIIFGPQGVGKTTAIAKAVVDSGQKWKWLLTNRHSLDRALSEGISIEIDPAWILSEHIPGKVDEATGQPIRAKTLKKVQKLLLGLEKKRLAGELDLDGIVISEGSTILEWIYGDIRNEIGAMQTSGIVAFGGRDRFDVSAVLRDFCNWFASFSSRNGLGLILDSHKRERGYWEEGQKAGELKYPAGPSAPEGNAMLDLTKPFQFVWELIGEGDPQESLWVLTRPTLNDDVIQTIRKTKGSKVKPKEEVTAESGLYEKFVRAGIMKPNPSAPTPAPRKVKVKKSGN